MMASKNFGLESSRLVLRPLMRDHVNRLAAILVEPDVTKTLLGDISTPERTRIYAAGWVSSDEFWKTHRFGFWGAFDRHGNFGAPDRLIGVVGADGPPPLAGEGPEVYYFFAREVWGAGIASEAVRCMFDYLFGIVGLPALEALVFAERNPASVRVLEKARMRLVGRMLLIGHHLSHRRARETMEFDVWRVRNASPDRVHATVSDAAFRMGQLVAEGVWSKAPAASALLAAAERVGLAAACGAQTLRDFIDARFVEGAQAKGVSHYRVRRGEYLTRRRSDRRA